MPHTPPKKILEQICTVAKDKTEQSWERILVLGFFAGSYISLGCLMAIMVGGGMPSIQEENPGLQRLVFGAVFTFGLMLCVISGSELYTANTIYILPSLIERRIKPLKIVKHLAFAYIGNFIGAVIVAGFFTKLAGLVDADPWNSFVNRFGENKVQIIWYQQLIRGIGCTWLVCLATWMSTASDEIIGKIFAIFFPITSFIAIGFDHLVANMYFIPLAMMNGANISGAEFVLNLVLLTVGNTFGGLILVGFLYWAAYGRQPVKKSSDLHYELLEDRK